MHCIEYPFQIDRGEEQKYELTSSCSSGVTIQAMIFLGCIQQLSNGWNNSAQKIVSRTVAVPGIPSPGPNR